MRKLIAAVCAAALAGTLFAVPAFADPQETVILESDYGDVTITFNDYNNDFDLSNLAVGMYRTSEGITLVFLPPSNAILSAYPYWQIGENSSTYHDSDIPIGTPLTTDSTGYFRILLRDEDHTTPARLVFHVTDLGDVGNDTIGIFGIATEGMGNAILWMRTFLNSIVSNPVLLFFCLALPLLTIGVTIIRRLLAVRA